MGLVYLPTNLPNKNQPLIYRSSHGPHGIGTRSPPMFLNPPSITWMEKSSNWMLDRGIFEGLRLGFQVKVGIPCLKIEDVILGGCCDYCDCHPGVGEGEPKTLHLNFHHSFRSQGYPWWWRNSSKEFFFLPLIRANATNADVAHNKQTWAESRWMSLRIAPTCVFLFNVFFLATEVIPNLHFKELRLIH